MNYIRDAVNVIVNGPKGAHRERPNDKTLQEGGNVGL